MTQEITVAMIDSNRLKLKSFPVQQQEIQLKIDGDTDSTTLQRLRDHIQPSVQHHKEVINKYIASTAVAVAKAKTPKEAEQLGKQARDGLEKMLRSAVPKVQASAQNFYTTDNEGKRLYEAGRVKFWAILSWVPVSLYVATVIVTDDGPQGWFLAIKGVVDQVKDIGTFLLDCKAAYEASTVDLKQLRDAIAEVRKIKPPKKVEAANLDKLKLKSKAYGARVLGLEMEAKTASKKLDEILKAQDKLKGAPKPVLARVEEVVRNQIDTVTKLNEAVEEGRKVLQSANDHIKNVEKRVNTTTDWSGWLDKLGKIYEACSTVIDIALGVQAGKYSEVAFAAGKYLGGLKIDDFKG